MNLFTIKDIENLTGIKAHTIRIWEQRYSFLKPQRSDTNIRYYNGEELRKILNISLLNKRGFKISHLDKMNAREINEKILALNDPEVHRERLVNELVNAMVELNIESFEKIVNEYNNKKGIEKAITWLLFPFLEKIGILWQTGHINPVQEHLVSNVIRQKLMVGIDQTKIRIIPNAKTFLLFLPEGEHHELGLLFVYYLLKQRNMKVIYLGPNIPLQDLDLVLEHRQPDVAYLHFSCIPNNFIFPKFLNDISARLKDIDIIISGFPTQSYNKKLPYNITFKYSLTEVTEYLDDL